MRGTPGDEERRIGHHVDHPRVCGEHAVLCAGVKYYLGSSPRMRGTLIAVCRVAVRNGIIPAYAGNTPDQRRTCHVRRDHPRVCGEHLTALS